MLAVPLGACSSFLGLRLGQHVPKSLPTHAATKSLQPAAQTSVRTEAGRRQLQDGNIGLAIESFRIALGSGEPIAPATNGLAVAYARLGRDDLAQRYFEEAIAADPGNERYSGNLAFLMRSHDDVTRHEEARAEASTSSSSSAVLGPPRDSPAPGSLQRISRLEVKIFTVPPQAAPFATRVAEVHKRPKPAVSHAATGQSVEPDAGSPLAMLTGSPSIKRAFLNPLSFPRGQRDFGRYKLAPGAVDVERVRSSNTAVRSDRDDTKIGLLNPTDVQQLSAAAATLLPAASAMSLTGPQASKLFGLIDAASVSAQARLSDENTAALQIIDSNRQESAAVSDPAEFSDHSIPIQIRGVDTGEVDFRLENDRILLRLASLLDLVRGRMDAAEFARFRSSKSSSACLSVADLRNAGLALGFDRSVSALVLSAA
jgi:hypothetical protein